MALTNTQPSLSDLFAPRGADSRVSRSQRRREISSGGAGGVDFGELMAGYSAKPVSQSRSEARDSHEDSARTESASRTVSSSKASSRKVSSRNLSSRNDAPPRDASDKQAVVKHESENGSRRLEPMRQDSGRQISTDGKSPDKKNVAKENQADVTPVKESSSHAIQLANEANVASTSESGLLSVKEAQVIAGQLTSEVDKSSLVTAQLQGLSEKSDNNPTVTDSSSVIESLMAEKLIGGNDQSVQQSIKAQRQAGNDAGKALTPQTIAASIGTDSLQSAESLLRAFDAKLNADAQGNKNADTSGASGSSESNTLKALKQLSSVKSIAPNIMRVLNAGKASQKQGIHAGNSPSQVVAPADSSLGVSGALIQDGVGGPVKPVSVTQGAKLPGGLSREMIALQNGAFKDATTVDGKNAGLDGAFQLQSDKAGLSTKIKEHSAIRTGKLILPESFASKLKSGMNSLRLQIAPKHLGPAQLTVKLIKDHVSGTLTVASEAAKVAALNSLDSLAQRLSAEGFTLDALNVDVQQGDSGQAQEEMKDRYAGLLQSSLALRTIEGADSLYSMGDSVVNQPRSAAASGESGILSSLEVNTLA